MSSYRVLIGCATRGKLKESKPKKNRTVLSEGHYYILLYFILFHHPPLVRSSATDMIESVIADEKIDTSETSYILEILAPLTTFSLDTVFLHTTQQARYRSPLRPCPTQFRKHSSATSLSAFAFIPACSPLLPSLRPLRYAIIDPCITHQIPHNFGYHSRYRTTHNHSVGPAQS